MNKRKSRFTVSIHKKYILVAYALVFCVANNAYFNDSMLYIKGGTGLVMPIGKARIGSGYNLDKKLKSNFQASFGLGSTITDHIRTDIVFCCIGDFSYNSMFLSSLKGNMINESQKIKIHTLMLGLYYDFSQSQKISPFIGAGIGVASIRPNSAMSFSAGSAYKVIKQGESSTNLAFGLTAGLSTKINKNIFLESWYQFSYLGKIKRFRDINIYKNNSLISSYILDFSSNYHINEHSINIGIRYML